jgi:hypothetical protein
MTIDSISSNIPSRITPDTAASYAEKMKQKGKDTIEGFLNHMKKSPAERLEEEWLKSHGYTKEKLAGMTEKERAAVFERMKRDITERLKQKAEREREGVNITV